MAYLTGYKSLREVCRVDRLFDRLDGFHPACGEAVEHAADAEKHLDVNVEHIRASVRAVFRENVRISDTSVQGMNAEQREVKEPGPRVGVCWENEFGKSMRYKSIRELSGKSGAVLMGLTGVADEPAERERHPAHRYRPLRCGGPL